VRLSECERCGEDFYIVTYRVHGSKTMSQIACDAITTLLVVPVDEENELFEVVAGFRRHRDTCEALEATRGAGAAGLPDQAGDEAGEIDEAKAKELSADLPKLHEPPDRGTS
jgi:hypothetical protein